MLSLEHVVDAHYVVAVKLGQNLDFEEDGVLRVFIPVDLGNHPMYFSSWTGP